MGRERRRGATNGYRSGRNATPPRLRGAAPRITLAPYFHWRFFPLPPGRFAAFFSRLIDGPIFAVPAGPRLSNPRSIAAEAPRRPANRVLISSLPVSFITMCFYSVGNSFVFRTPVPAAGLLAFPRRSPRNPIRRYPLNFAGILALC